MDKQKTPVNPLPKNMKRTKSIFVFLIHITLTLTSSGDEDSKPPRWLLLGDDAALKQTYAESADIFLACIYETTLEEIRVPFATVVHKATVVRVLKGDTKIGDKVELAFATDSLPYNAKEREQYIEKANTRARGSLRFVFPYGRKKMRFLAEFLDIPEYSEELSDFLNSLASK